MTVRNQFGGDVELTTVVVSTGGDSVELSALRAGEQATATFANANCGDTIAIGARGDGVDVKRERAVEC